MSAGGVDRIWVVRILKGRVDVGWDWFGIFSSTMDGMEMLFGDDELGDGDEEDEDDDDDDDCFGGVCLLVSGDACLGDSLESSRRVETRASLLESDA